MLTPGNRWASLGKKWGVAFATFLLLFALVESGLALYQDHVVSRLLNVGELQHGRAVLCLGDSVTAGQDFLTSEAWPAQLERMLRTSGIKVINYAVPSASSIDLPKKIKLMEASGFKRPLVITMIGHNDFFDLLRFNEDNNIPVGLQRFRRPMASSEPKWVFRSRLLRFIKFSLSGLHSEVPRLYISEARRARYFGHIASLNAWVRSIGGELVLSTYLVPGPPWKELRPDHAKLLNVTRHAQMKINELIRNVAQENGLTLIDLEKLISVPQSGGQALFIDNIHLSLYGHEVVARTIHKVLPTSFTDF